MNIKKQILKRVVIVLIMILVLLVVILVKLILIQFKEGEYWNNFSDSMHLSKKLILADRGTIYSEDGNIISASMPYYNIYIDFNAPMMNEKNGKMFISKIDSLSIMFSKTFGDRTSLEYKTMMINGHKKQIRYFLLKKDVPYKEYKKILNFPFINKAKNKYSSGFIFVVKEKRIYPYGNLANRTIGFLRNNANWNLGLENAYDSILKGERKYTLMKYISGNDYVPIDGYNLTTENGKDIITTLNMKIQSIAEQALIRVLKKNVAEWGTCIIMEVSTGKIKAIVNLSQVKDSLYQENVNYALKRSEPGSTIKLLSMLALLEDKYISINDLVDLNEGQFYYGKNITMFDSEKHKVKKTTVKHAFAISSNVGISRLVSKYYSDDPKNFIKYFKKLHLENKTGFDLKDEESEPKIINTKSKFWSKTTSLPWMSIGYGIEISPLQTLMFYNAVANNGTMVKPYLVSKIIDQEVVYKNIEPTIIEEKICSDKTLKNLKELLKAVIDTGTAKKIFRNCDYNVTGKTGTNLFYEENKGYKDSAYQSSFVGFFPSQNPEYSCIVVVKNKPKAANYYGATAAAPVFKEIADKLIVLKGNLKEQTKEEKQISLSGVKYKEPELIKHSGEKIMPNLIGANLSDAINTAELLGLKVEVEGSGNVSYQSIRYGSSDFGTGKLKIILK